MALQVWLPLNGDLKNKGLDSDYDTPSMNYAAWAEEGKISSKSLHPTTKTSGVLTYSKTLRNDHSYTMCVWAKSETSESIGSRYILWTGSDSGGVGFGFYMIGTTVRAYMFGVYITCNIGVNEWHHITMVSDYENLKFSLYLDGIFVSSKTYTVKNISNFGVSVGWLRPSYYPFVGCINDVRIYDHCLSPKEIKEISQGLILHYKLDNYIGKNLVNNCKNITTGWGKYVAVDSLTYENGRVKAVGASSGSPRIYNSTILPYASTQEYYTIYIDYECDSNISVSGKSSNSTTSLNERGAQSIGTVTRIKRIDLGNNHKIDVYSWYRLAATDTIKSSWWMISFAVNATLYINSIKVEKGLNENIFWTPYNIEYPVIDSSGYNNNGTINGSLSVNDDTIRYNKSTKFGNGNYISPSIFPSFLTNEATVSMWVKLDQLPPSNPGRTMLYTAWYGFSCEVTSAGKTYFRTNLTSGSCDSPQGTLTVGNWIHWVGIKSSTGVSLYLNGVLVGTNSNSNNFNWTNNISNKIASYQTSYFLYGQLSDFRIYATALSAEDVRQLYQVGASIDNMGNVHSYEFDESESNCIEKTGVSNFNIKEQDTITKIYKQVNPNLLQGTQIDSFRYERTTGMSTEFGRSFTPTQQLQTWTYYTFSALVRGKANMSLYTINTGGNISFTYINKKDMDENEFKLFSVTFRVTGDRTINQIYPCSKYGESNTLVGDWYEIKENSIKLEEGEICTPWIPSETDAGYRAYNGMFGAKRFIEI